MKMPKTALQTKGSIRGASIQADEFPRPNRQICEADTLISITCPQKKNIFSV